MSQFLMTGYNADHAPIGDLTSPIMREYAQHHGMEFEIFKFGMPMHCAWQKLYMVKEVLECRGYDLALWLDADTIITDPCATLDRIMGAKCGLHVSRDWGSDALDETHFSTGNFIVCRDAMPIYHEALGREEEFSKMKFYGQDCLRQLYREHEWTRDLVTLHPRRILNAVPVELYGAQEPWRPGDFLCHLTGVSVPRKVELFHLMMGRLN